MRILIACEYSGRVRAAFRSLGHDAWSADLPAEDNGPHIQVTLPRCSASLGTWSLRTPLAHTCAIQVSVGCTTTARGSAAKPCGAAQVGERCAGCGNWYAYGACPDCRAQVSDSDRRDCGGEL